MNTVSNQKHSTSSSTTT